MAQRRTEEARVTLKVPEAAQILGTGNRAVRNLIKANVIPHLKCGRNIIIPRSAFLRWIDSAGGAR
jgi:excisionase family DNA binding protein